jgi:hypothetical protein
VQVVDAICINISENDQEIAALMVTVDATQCMTRAKRKKNEAAAVRRCGCPNMTW